MLHSLLCFSLNSTTTTISYHFRSPTTTVTILRAGDPVPSLSLSLSLNIHRPKISHHRPPHQNHPSTVSTAPRPHNHHHPHQSPPQSSTPPSPSTFTCRLDMDVVPAVTRCRREVKEWMLRGLEAYRRRSWCWVWLCDRERSKEVEGGERAKVAVEREEARGKEK